MWFRPLNGQDPAFSAKRGQFRFLPKEIGKGARFIVSSAESGH